MNTEIAKTINGKDYNRFNQIILDCKKCGNKTTMTGTKLCDSCWEQSRRDDNRRTEADHQTWEQL